MHPGYKGGAKLLIFYYFRLSFYVVTIYSYLYQNYGIWQSNCFNCLIYMHWLLIAIFIVIGLLFMVLEILVIPGAGFAGIVGFILIAIGIWQSYSVFGAMAGHMVLGGTFLLTVITLVLSLRGRTWRKFMLSTEIDGKVNMIDAEKIRVGDSGKTISRLAPMGKALINGEFYEVRTDGDFVEQHTDIVVDKIEYNKIYVKRKDQDHG